MLKSKISKLVVSSIVIFSILSSLISFYPLLKSGPRAVIFNFEPEVAYVANALSYIGFKEISYTGHPATPSILAIAYSFTPLRLYAKYIDHMPFFLWTIKNEIFLFYYTRVFVSAIFALATGIFLYSIYKFTESFKSLLFSWIGLFLYSNTPYLGIIPQSEPLSFLILSLWLLVFCNFLSKKTLKIYLILSGLAALSVANKLPNMFFVMASLIQIFSFPKLKLVKRIKYFLYGVGVTCTLFVIGTWPIKNQYLSLWQWIVQLATHTGIHGRGDNNIFSLATHFNSLNTLFLLEKGPTILILITLVFWFIYIKNKKSNITLPINLFFGSLLLGIAVFGKFSLSHYHQFHYIGILFIASYLVSKFYKGIYWMAIALLIIFSFKNISNYWKINIIETNYSISLEEFVHNNPPKIATVWEWGRSLDYSLIHIRDWIGIRYSIYLNPERPNLLSLSTDMTKIVVSQDNEKEVFSACWDQLYIQGSELPRFINKYPKNKIVTQSIPGSKDMWLITSNHCLEK